MNVIIEARTLLETAGYRTVAVNTATDRFFFEDVSILGLVTEHGSVEGLLQGWEKVQDNFLAQYAGKLRTNPAKAWNIYTVHLTTQTSSTTDASKLFAIEEDFRGTRKIARTSIGSKDALRMALLPLLPIQNQVSLTRADLAERLKGRLSLSDPSLVHLLSESTPLDISSRLLEGK